MELDLLSPCLLAAGTAQPWPPLWALELLAKVLLGAWLFYFGACVGSFLNVVVYRLPRGMNLVHPGSRCPQCGHAIRARDNLPVFSWLWLRGRCRDCHSPISPRYYYVELVLGLIFLLVAVFEAFLPLVEPGTSAGAITRRLLSLHDGAPFWCAYATHVGLAATLVGATLMEYDGCRVPWKLFLPMIVVGFILPLVWPAIRPLAAAVNLQVTDWQAGLIDGLAGVAAGGALGLIAGAGWWLGAGRRMWPRFAPLALWATAGCVLGWQRVFLLAPLAGVTYTCGVAATARMPIVFPLAAAVLAPLLPQLCGVDLGPFPLGDLRDRWEQIAMTAAALVVAAAALAAGRLAGPSYFASPPLPIADLPAQPPTSATTLPAAADPLPPHES